MVAHRDNALIWGRVLAFEGSVVTIRRQHPDPAAGQCWREQYHIFELELIDNGSGDDGGREEPPTDNIIPVDFTKKGKLTANTKTKGRA